MPLSVPGRVVEAQLLSTARRGYGVSPGDFFYGGKLGRIIFRLVIVVLGDSIGVKAGYKSFQGCRGCAGETVYCPRRREETRRRGGSHLKGAVVVSFSFR